MSQKNKEIVEKVNAAFIDNKPEDFLSFCDENVEWTMVGEKTSKGKKEIREWMASMEGMEPPKFTVDEIIAEGDTVVCHGGMKMKGEDGEPGDYSYCDIYRFNNGKIARLQSFVVKHKKEGETDRRAAA